jgi:hypothetical protein
MGEPAAEASALIAQRQAEVVKGKSADNLFSDLRAKVDALTALNQPSPLTVAVAEEEVKLCLSEPEKHKIRLHDLLVNEAVKARRLIKPVWSELSGSITGEQLRHTTAQTESALEVLGGMLCQGAYHGPGNDLNPWVEAIRLVMAEIRGSSWSIYTPHRYPGVFLSYCIGVPSVASGRYDLLRALAEIQISRDGQDAEPWAEWTHPWEWVSGDFAKKLISDTATNRTPISDYLLTSLMPFFERIIPDAKRWEELFDQWEVLFCLLQSDHLEQTGSYSSPFHGRFGWRSWYSEPRHPSVSAPLATPLTYKPLQEGLFGGSKERFGAAVKRLDEAMRQRSSSLIW